MNVTFTRTGEKRYRVSINGPGLIPSYMEPAAGYDARLPHDLAHFVVEKMFGIMGCIYGPLSKGGGSFRPVDETKKRKAAKRGNQDGNFDQKEAEMTERIIDIAGHAWTGHEYTGAHVKGVSADDIARVCREFDAVSSVWSKLKVGQSMTLEWAVARKGAKRRDNVRYV